MGKTKSNKPRQMDFASAVQYLTGITDQRSDQKFLENSKQFTAPLASLRTRVEVLEDLLMEKFGETEISLAERVLGRVEKQQGFQQVDEPAKLGSIVRIKVKEELVDKESPNNPMEDAFMVVGQNQIHSSVDELLLGASAGDTKSTSVPNPKDATQLIKVTVFLAKVFKGRETPNEEVKTETAATPEAAPQDPQNQANG